MGGCVGVPTDYLVCPHWVPQLYRYLLNVYIHKSLIAGEPNVCPLLGCDNIIIGNSERSAR